MKKFLLMFVLIFTISITATANETIIDPSEDLSIENVVHTDFSETVKDLYHNTKYDCRPGTPTHNLWVQSYIEREDPYLWGGWYTIQAAHNNATKLCELTYEWKPGDGVRR